MGTQPLPKKGAEPPPQFSARVYCGQTVGDIRMPLGMETANGLVQLFLHSLQHKVPILYNGRPYPPEVPFATDDLDLPWAEGCTSLIVFARWRQCALMGGHVAGTCRITLNHPYTAAMCLMANYFDHLLDTPLTQSRIQQSASSRVLYCGHSTEYSHLVYIYIYSTKPVFTKVITRVGYVFANTVFATQSTT